MTEPDDIVTRLRAVDKWSDVIGVCDQAADEIERLRDQVVYWRDIANGVEDHPVPAGVRRFIQSIEKALDRK